MGIDSDQSVAIVRPMSLLSWLCRDPRNILAAHRPMTIDAVQKEYDRQDRVHRDHVALQQARANEQLGRATELKNMIEAMGMPIKVTIDSGVCERYDHAYAETTLTMEWTGSGNPLKGCVRVYAETHDDSDRQVIDLADYLRKFRAKSLEKVLELNKAEFTRG